MWSNISWPGSITVISQSWCTFRYQLWLLDLELISSRGIGAGRVIFVVVDHSDSNLWSALSKRSYLKYCAMNTKRK